MAKTKTAKDTKAPKRRRVNWRVDADALERLAVHCIRQRRQPAAIISDLIREHLQDCLISAWPGKREPGQAA